MLLVKNTCCKEKLLEIEQKRRICILRQAVKVKILLQTVKLEPQSDDLHAL